jgi:dTDP-4-dehydrorhamnose reductase
VRELLKAEARGIFHFSHEGETTFFDFAAFVLAHAGRKETPLAGIPTSDLPKGAYPAPRPLYAVLSKEKYRKATGAAPRLWEDAVLDFLRTRNEGGRMW